MLGIGTNKHSTVIAIGLARDCVIIESIITSPQYFVEGLFVMIKAFKIGWEKG